MPRVQSGPSASAAQFDLQALFVAVDAERQEQGLSWAALSLNIGVAASTIRRYRVADDAEADGVLAAVRWLGTTPETFVPGSVDPGRPLASSGAGYPRVDMQLVSLAEGNAKGAEGRTRTTIQKLVAVAQRSNQAIASLTQISPL